MTSHSENSSNRIQKQIYNCLRVVSTIEVILEMLWMAKWSLLFLTSQDSFAVVGWEFRALGRGLVFCTLSIVFPSSVAGARRHYTCITSGLGFSGPGGRVACVLALPCHLQAYTATLGCTCPEAYPPTVTPLRLHGQCQRVWGRSLIYGCHFLKPYIYRKFETMLEYSSLEHCHLCCGSSLERMQVDRTFLVVAQCDCRFILFYVFLVM